MEHIIDIDGKKLEMGHIVAVRYVWNSYVGEVNMRGLCSTGAKRHAFFSPHAITDTATYQILGHTDPSHSDFNSDVLEWYTTETKTDCPVRIKVYDNFKTE